VTRRIVILNPNATEAMTDDMVTTAAAIAGAGIEVSGMTNHRGPPAIQGAADAEACLPGLFGLAEQATSQDADALIIGCFDDTGLAAMRARFPCPVIGLGEAGMLMATLNAPRFAVLTTTDGSVPVIRDNIEAMGLAPRCDVVRAAGIPVLDLGARIDDLRAALRKLAGETDGAAIVLGCAGMSPLATALIEPGQPRLVDPVRAAIALAASTLDAGLGQARSVRDGHRQRPS
jgi:allantoin racemase